ncbi:MAG: T9SS type A sorting domain-containing protein [Bacteroidota bacterium]
MNQFARLLPILLFILFGYCESSAQVNFFLTQANVIPANPDSETPIAVEILGSKSDPCSYLASSSVDINNSLVTITLNWENTANQAPFDPCPSNMQEAWDSTFNVGTLEAGTYFLVFAGNNFFLTGLPNSIPFTVSDPSCMEPDGSILVTNTLDNGVGSLRQAILCANEMPGANTIKFDLPGTGPDTIRVGETTQTALPTLTDANTIIDGSTHPGFGGPDHQPKVILDGQYHNWDLPINALWIQGNGCAVYALEIVNFPDDAIDVTQANNVAIGAVGKGNVIFNNGSPIDFFPGAPGTGPWEACGIVIRGNASNCSVKANTIGTNFSQTIDSGNEFCGILIRDGGDNNVIGGSTPEEGNIVANHPSGLQIRSGSIGNRIQQNSFYCNDTSAIALQDNANLGIIAPQVTVATGTTIIGTASPNQSIEVYVSDHTNCVDAPCQGSIYLGTAAVQNGNWQLLPPFANGVQLSGGEQITALATDSNNNTSEFATCLVVVGVSDCTDDQGIVWVTNTNDEGDGSLRAAINCVNATPGSNKIYFNIPGTGPHTIEVGSTSGEALPALLDQSTILDASTQTGFGDNGNFAPQISLDGQTYEWELPINALWVRGDYCEVYALEIINFPDDAIDVNQANFVVIGAVEKGNVIYNNGWEQDFFSGVPNTGPWNGCGIVLRLGAEESTIQGNIIGTNYQGDVALGNEFCGILIQDGGDNHVIGGPQVGAGNIIAHHETGIRIQSNSIGNLIQQNSLYCNELAGIQLLGNANNMVASPTIDTVDAAMVAGSAVNASFVEVYVQGNEDCSEAPCQGRFFLGQATVVGGNWILEAPFTNGIEIANGNLITAIATDVNQNSSEYAACVLFQCSLSLSIENQIAATCGEANGGFSLVVNNGTGPYLYDLGNGAVNSPEFNNLASGNYQVTVTDANDCTGSIALSITATPPPTLILLSATDASCELPNGSIDVVATGGTGPYTYLLLGATSDGPPFTGLTGGDYTIVVIDADDCSDTLMTSIATSPAPALSIVSVVDATCGLANGMLTLAGNGGTPPYVYQLDGQTSTSPIFSNLSSGVYNVSVVDANDCVDSQSVTIGDTPLPDLSVAAITSATCDGANGSFTLSTNSGTPPYVYRFGQISTSNSTFTGLSGGIYSVTVEDANNCMDTESITIGNTPAPLIAVSNVMTATCGEANGAITVSASEGTPPYLFDLGNGPTNFPVFDNLPGGIYNVSVVDANSCTASLTAIIGDTPAPILELLTVTHPTCGQANGAAVYSGTGGTSPYTYTIGLATFTTPVFTSVSGGIYEVTMTDALGCTAVESFELTDPGVPQPTMDELAHATCGLANGFVAIGAFEGMAPYTFDIGNGSVSNGTFPNLAEGTYVVTVTDNIGCTNTIEVMIDNVGDPTNAAFVFQENEGVVDFTNSSTNGQTYFWDFGDGNSSSEEHPSHEYLLDGDYTVCLTSTNECGDDLFCTLVSIVLPLAEGSISGIIATELGTPIAAVTVNCTDEAPFLTLADGHYDFILPAAEDYTITPAKNTSHANGVNIFDIYLIQQHILAVQPLDSPYKIIAADVDHNEVVNIADIFRMQQVILNIVDTFPNNTAWRFVPFDHVFPNPSFPFASSFPEDLFFPNLLDDFVDQDFVAIKTGDVTLNADPTLIAQSPIPNLQWLMSEQAAEAGDVIEVEISARQFTALAAWQMNLKFDAENLEWLGMAKEGLPGFEQDQVYLSDNGDLRMLWYDEQLQGNGQSYTEDQSLFTLRFRVLQPFTKLSEQLYLANTNDLYSAAYQANGDRVAMEFVFIETTSTTPLASQAVLEIFPNPFQTQSNIHVQLPQAQALTFSLYDAVGRLVKSERLSAARTAQFVIDGQALSGAGIYFWKVETAGEHWQGKLLFTP